MPASQVSSALPLRLLPVYPYRCKGSPHLVKVSWVMEPEVLIVVHPGNELLTEQLIRTRIQARLSTKSYILKVIR